MTLTAEQIEYISQFGQLEYSPRDIAEIIGVDQDEFELEAKTPGTEIYKYLRIAKLKSEGEISANLLNSAKTSVTAQQLYYKHTRQQELKAAKRRIDGKQDDDKPVSKYALKSKYNEAKEDYEALRELVMKGVPTENYNMQMQEYWMRLKTAHDLFLNFENMAKGRPYVVNLLKARFDISEATAYRYISEAIDFFGMDLSREQFKKVQIAKLDKAIALAWELDRMDWVAVLVKEQNEIAGLKRDEPDKIPDEALKQKVIVATGDPKALGAEPVDKTELTDLVKQIIKKGLTEEEGRKIARDAGVTDINWEEIYEDGDTEPLS
jgi:hypothetical protein